MEVLSDSAALFVPQIQALARGLADALRGHVFLTGSALRSMTPRDIDIRCVLSSAAFEARYGRFSVGRWIAQGRTGQWGPSRWIWSKECVDFSQHASEQTGLNVDFQIYPEGYLVGERLLLAEPVEVPETWLKEAEIAEATRKAPS